MFDDVVKGSRLEFSTKKKIVRAKVDWWLFAGGDGHLRHF